MNRAMVEFECADLAGFLQVFVGSECPPTLLKLISFAWTALCDEFRWAVAGISIQINYMQKAIIFGAPTKVDMLEP